MLRRQFLQPDPASGFVQRQRLVEQTGNHRELGRSQEHTIPSLTYARPLCRVKPQRRRLAFAAGFLAGRLAADLRPREAFTAGFLASLAPDDFSAGLSGVFSLAGAESFAAPVSAVLASALFESSLLASLFVSLSLD